MWRGKIFLIAALAASCALALSASRAFTGMPTYTTGLESPTISSPTITGTATLSGGNPDVTTGTNEDLTLTPNGSGDIRLGLDSGTSLYSSTTFSLDSSGNLDAAGTGAFGGAVMIAAGALADSTIREADLMAVDAASDEECLTYETTTGDFEWQACGGGGAVATDTIWDAAGDLAVGTGADTAARLAKPTAAGMFLHYNGTTAVWSPYSMPTTAAANGTIPHWDGTNMINGTIKDIAGAVTGVTTLNASGQVVVSAGSAGTPAISFGADYNSGFYSPADGMIGAVSNGTVLWVSPSGTLETPAYTFRLDDSVGLGWSTEPGSVGDEIVLYRSAANTLRLTDGLGSAVAPSFVVDGNVFSSVAATITASATSIQGGSPLTKDVNEISICATAGDSVTLPAAIAGLRITIINHGAASADVFPASADAINEAAADTAKALAADASMMCFAYDATNWECLTLAR